MKKIYMTPSAVVIKVEMNVLAPVSGFEKNTDPASGITDEGAVLSRRGGFWDEEDEY